MRTTIPVLLVLSLAAACDARSAPAADGAIRVAATLHPIASIIGFVGGDAVTVRTLLPPGAHPDTYEATPRMAQALAGADLLVRVGGAVDDWVGERRRGDHLVLSAGITLRGTPHRHDGRGHGTGNPHVWLDPILVRDEIIPVLTGALVERAPAEMADSIRQRAAAFADSLSALDTEIRDALRDARIRRFISVHPAWIYFAERYGLEEIGSLHPSPGSELGARELARLVDQARQRGGVAVIAEPQLGRAGVAALAAELGVPVEVADPVGGPGLEGREDYLALMRYNARAFRRAMGAAAP